MGMDYIHSGSASYDRFAREHEEIVKLFGGTPTDDLIRKQNSVKEGTMAWWMGHQYEVDNKYNFPADSNLPKAFIKWANNPYGRLTIEETSDLLNTLIQKEDKVEKISYQILHEVKTSCLLHETWHIRR